MGTARPDRLVPRKGERRRRALRDGGEQEPRCQRQDRPEAAETGPKMAAAPQAAPLSAAAAALPRRARNWGSADTPPGSRRGQSAASTSFLLTGALPANGLRAPSQSAPPSAPRPHEGRGAGGRKLRFCALAPRPSPPAALMNINDVRPNQEVQRRQRFGAVLAPPRSGTNMYMHELGGAKRGSL